MVGLQIFVEFTDAEGKTYESDPTAPVDDGIYTFEIEDAKATKVNEITVTFANPVEAKNVTFKVTKGDLTIATEGEPEWNTDEKVVTIKTTANMGTGTYTVTATDSVTKDTAYANFEVEAQRVDSIVILAGENNTALTNRETDGALATHKAAYAYYDVLDQYKQSMRASTSIQWSGSAKIKADKANGKLTFSKNDGSDWVYNDKIYVTGVYVKEGVTKNATLTVGTEQALNSIEMVGFLKKGTAKILDTLPADFKEGEYYLLFHAMDQNGNPLKAGVVGKEDVTFVPDNVLVVKELTEFAGNALTVDGTEYDGIFVTPGIQVATGGQVTISAIANKTGHQTDLNIYVGPDPVVTSFKLLDPTGTVADGDTVKILYEAIDDKNNPITNFRALAKQEIFNTLSFNASEGTLKLKENDKGEAELTWSDEDKYQGNNGWDLSVTTDGIDRPISLSVVVVGGEPHNTMLYVQDKRRPDAISEVNLKDVYVEGAEMTISLASFKFIDQYQKLIGSTWGADNGFFAAAAAPGTLHGIDFADYTFGVRIENAGSGKVVDNGGTTTYTADPDGKKSVITDGNNKGFATTVNIKNAATNEGFKFEIAKFKASTDPTITIDDPTDWEAVSPTKFKGFTVVDIGQVKNFEITDLNTLYVGALNITGDKVIPSNLLDTLKDEPAARDDTGSFTVEPDATQGAPKGLREAGDYRDAAEVKVTGTYGTKSVDIPSDYFDIETTLGTLVDTPVNGKGDNKFDDIDTIKITDLYDKTSASGKFKLGEDEVKATLYKLYEEYGYYAWDAINGLHLTEDLDGTAATNTLTADALAAEQLKIVNNILTVETDRTAQNLPEFLAGTYNTAVTLAQAQEEYNNASTDATTKANAAASAKTADDNAKTAVDTAGNKTLSDGGSTKVKDATGMTAIVGTITKNTSDQDITNQDLSTVTEATTTADEALVRAYLTAVRNQKDTADKLTTANAANEAAQNALAAKTAQIKLVESKEAKAAAEEYATDVWQAAKDANGAGPTSAGGDELTSTKAPITFSDQAPYAAKIDGLEESYTFVPTNTVIGNAVMDAALDVNFELLDDDLSILDQYGIEYAGILEYTISDIEESKDGYAENNFKVVDNGTNSPSIEGAELGDTFDLVVSVQGETLKAKTSVTVGSDTWAAIENSNNYYKDVLKKTLEKQRKAGLQ